LETLIKEYEGLRLDKKLCSQYIEMGIWVGNLCKWCKQASCKEREHLPLEPLVRISNRNRRFYVTKEKEEGKEPITKAK